MKKKTEIYNRRYGRKWKSTWVVLVLVFSIISVPAAGEKDNTGNGRSIGLSPEQVIIESDSSGNSENAGMSQGKENEEIGSTDNSKNTEPG